MSTFLFGILKEEPELLCDITLKKKRLFVSLKMSVLYRQHFLKIEKRNSTVLKKILNR